MKNISNNPNIYIFLVSGKFLKSIPEGEFVQKFTHSPFLRNLFSFFFGGTYESKLFGELLVKAVCLFHRIYGGLLSTVT